MARGRQRWPCWNSIAVSCWCAWGLRRWLEAVGDSTFPTFCVGLEADRSLHAEQQEGLDAPFLPSWPSIGSRASIASWWSFPGPLIAAEHSSCLQVFTYVRQQQCLLVVSSSQIHTLYRNEVSIECCEAQPVWVYLLERKWQDLQGKQ